MLSNYEYFIALAEELNISKSAQKLFISHQCLSKYLKNLEQEYGVTLFDRSPHLALTPAGEACLNTFRQVQFLEENLKNQLEDIRMSKRGLIRFGTTEGRYRILIPTLLSEFNRINPYVKLDTSYDTSEALCSRLMKNELDFALMNKRDISMNQLEMQPILKEKLYLVISDHMLAQYFPSEYPTCKESFQKGVDLAAFCDVPFVLNFRGFNSREIIEEHLQARGLQLKCAQELTQQDLHFMLAVRDYAACFCWAMYVPSIHQNNQLPSMGHLNVFPIKGLSATNQVVLVLPKGKILPAYSRDFIRLIRQSCTEFSGESVK